MRTVVRNLGGTPSVLVYARQRTRNSPYSGYTSLKPKVSYNVYLVFYEGMPRDHLAIFFETNADESGFIYQVSGNIQQGMKHDHKRAKKPENSESFVKQEYLGKTTHANYPRVEGICNAIEPPQKQFEGARRLYPQQPLRRCQEWTKEALDALRDAGVLEN